MADILTDEPRSLVAVASELDVEPTALVRLLRHLASLGVFAVRADNVWNNEASRLLRTGHPGELLPLTRMLGLPIMWDSFGALEETIRTGRAGATLRDPGGLFAYLDAHPAESTVYDEGMAAMTTRRISRVVPHYDFSAFNVIADIGGGGGHLLRAVLDRAPQARGVLFDREQVLQGLAPSDRVTLHSGSFLADPLPAADCYLLSNVIHDWSDDDALTILRAVREAASTESTLLLFEFVIPRIRASSKPVTSTSTCWRWSAAASDPSPSTTNSSRNPVGGSSAPCRLLFSRSWKQSRGMSSVPGRSPSTRTLRGCESASDSRWCDAAEAWVVGGIHGLRR